MEYLALTLIAFVSLGAALALFRIYQHVQDRRDKQKFERVYRTGIRE